MKVLKTMGMNYEFYTDQLQIYNIKINNEKGK